MALSFFKDCTGNEQIYSTDVPVRFSMSKKVWSKWRTGARIIRLNTSLPRCTYVKLCHREIQDYEHRR